MSSDEMKLILEKLEKLDEIESRQRSMETGIINLGTRMEAVESRLDNLEGAFETRLLETMPRWAGEMLKEMRQGFQKLDRDLTTLARDMITLRSAQRLLEDEVEDLKKKVS